ncbi:MAG: hypothetical protein IH631_10320, partial [Candidatus Thorarchaeota archaeon]|nr:hypothetical protein [Candidatus Thorarchaeota archaeon]
MSKKGKGKLQGQRPTALILLVVILAATNIATLAYFVVVDNSVPFADVPQSIADVTGDNSSIGKMVSVIGYLIFAADNYSIVSNPLSFFNNSLDFSNHIIITGSVPEGFEDHLGFQICVKGVLEIVDSSDGSRGLGYESFFDIEAEISVP